MTRWCRGKWDGYLTNLRGNTQVSEVIFGGDTLPRCGYEGIIHILYHQLTSSKDLYTHPTKTDDTDPYARHWRLLKRPCRSFVTSVMAKVRQVGAKDPMTKPERNDPAPYSLVGMYSLWVFTLRCGKQFCVKSGTTYLFGTFSFSKFWLASFFAGEGGFANLIYIYIGIFI